MIQALLTLVAALPKLISLVDRLEKSFGKGWHERIVGGLDEYEALKNAKTEAERREAESRLARIWLGTGRD